MSLLRNIHITFLSRAGVIGLSLLSAVIVSRTLGPEGRGVFTAVFLLPAFASSLGMLGMAGSSLYFTSHEPERRWDVMGVSVTLAVLFSLLYGAVLWLLWPYLEDTYYGSIDVFLYIALGLAFGPLSIVRSFFGATLRGMYRIREYNFLLGHGFHALRVVVLFVVLVVLGWGVFGAIVSQLFCYLASDVGLGIALSREVSLKPGWDGPLVKRMFSYGLQSFTGAAVTRADHDADSFFLAVFLTPTDLGLYTVAYMMANQIRIVGDSVKTALLPKVSALKDRADAVRYIALPTRNVLPVLVAVFLAYLAVGRLAIHLLHGEAFLPAFLPSVVLVGSVSAHIVLDNFQTYYQGTGRPLIKTVVRGAGLAVHLALLLLLLPEGGVMGAAWSYAGSAVTMATIYAVLFLRESRVPVRELLLVQPSDARFYRETLEAVREGVRRLVGGDRGG